MLAFRMPLRSRTRAPDACARTLALQETINSSTLPTRPQDIAAGNIPANIKPAPIEPPQSSAQQRPQAAAPKPRQEVMAAAAAQQPQQQPPQRPGRRPDPPRPAKPLADAPPPLPEMAETWFGASLFDWLVRS